MSIHYFRALIPDGNVTVIWSDAGINSQAELRDYFILSSLPNDNYILYAGDFGPIAGGLEYKFNLPLISKILKKGTHHTDYWTKCIDEAMAINDNSTNDSTKIDSITSQSLSNTINPAHYKLRNGLEVIDILEDIGIAKDYCRGNAIKYLIRAGRKDNVAALEDYSKAQWYVDKLVELMSDSE